MRQLQDNGDTHAVEKMREIKDEINGNTGNREREGKGRRKSWADWMLSMGWLVGLDQAAPNVADSRLVLILEGLIVIGLLVL